MKKHLIAITLIGVFVLPIFSQNEQLETIQLSGSRIRQAIEIVANRKEDKVTFTVKNRSYYRFEVELEIKEIENLVPSAFSRTYSIGYGNTLLTTLTRKDAERNFTYRYLSNISLENSDAHHKDFMYLHPIGANRPISNKATKENFSIGVNNYVLRNNDTVFAMRKGFIVADNKKLTVESRLYDEGSLEVLHDDGTVMVYMLFDKDDESLIKRGQEIFPGQPLYVNNTGDKTLQIGLFRIYENRVIGINPVFNCCNDKNDNDSCFVSYPSEIITKEMSKGETKKYLKGKLY